MINSIQSYQNTPKLTTNKAKTNNSPNFCSTFDLKIEGLAANTVREVIRDGRQSPFCGIVKAIKEWKAAITNRLAADSNPDSIVHASLQELKGDQNGLRDARVFYNVEHKGQRVFPNDPLTLMINRDEKGNYVIAFDSLVTDAANTMKKIDDAASDAEACKELLPEAEKEAKKA